MATTTETAPSPTPAPAWATTLHRLADLLACDLGGGPRPWTFAAVIDCQKGGTLPFLGLLMAWYGDPSPASWIYLAMHGGYGLAWLIKDLAFPDPAWRRRITVGGGLFVFFGVLAWYWSFGWLLISGASRPTYPLPDPAWFALCVGLCLVGTAIMMAADAQKFYTLRLRPGLITDGLFRHVRHPNYLGEMMIYGSFAMMAWHWLPAVVLASVWTCVFAPNMAVKEARLSRHPGWAAYRRRTWWLLPGVF